MEGAASRLASVIAPIRRLGCSGDDCALGIPTQSFTCWAAFSISLPFPLHRCFLVLHPSRCSYSWLSKKDNYSPSERPHREREKRIPPPPTPVHAHRHSHLLVPDRSHPCHFTQQSRSSHGGNVGVMKEEKNHLVISLLKCCQLCTAFHPKAPA